MITRIEAFRGKGRGAAKLELTYTRDDLCAMFGITKRALRHWVEGKYGPLQPEPLDLCDLEMLCRAWALCHGWTPPEGKEGR